VNEASLPPKAARADDARGCPAWYHEDNVFPSRARMDWAHRPIVVRAARVLDGRGGDVLDLGCGNGALLRKIHAVSPRTVPFGIEREPDRVAHARLLLPGFAGNVVAGDLFDAPALWSARERFALALRSPRRLLEAGPQRSRPLLDWIRARCDRLLVYAYGKGRTEHGDLAGFARAAGIEIDATGARARAGLARRW
jgi:hypothetical protein